MHKIIEAAITRSRVTLSILAFLVLVGLISFNQMAVELEPNIEVPFVVVTVPLEGISPEDAERLLVLPLEEELRSVDGIKEMTSYAAEGSATVTLEFDIDVDRDDALVEVREGVDRAKAEMPTSILEPRINPVSTLDFPTIVVNLTGDRVPERLLYNIAVNMRDKINNLNNVMEANLAGHREEVVEVIIDSAALETYDIVLQDLISVSVANNRLVAAGSLDLPTGRFAVKVPGLIKTYTDLHETPVKVTGDSVITLGQLAEIKRTFKDRTTYTRVNGRPAISVEVIKRLKSNIIDTAAEVRALVGEIKPTLPPSVEIFYTTDIAPMAEQQVDELFGNVITAMMLVMIIVVASLGLRSGLLVGMGIPISFIMSFILLNYIEYTFNFMVMFGLLLALGILIDGAIVVTEYADRKLAEGYDSRTAFIMASKRMFWPVTASTATTLAAFLPLFLWPGVSGRFMVHLPITVFAVLIGSLAFALIFGPTIGSLIGKVSQSNPRALDEIRTLEYGDPTKLKNLTGLYARFLTVIVRWPILVTVLTVAILIGAFQLYSRSGGGLIFFANSDPEWGQVSVSARGNLSAEEVRDLVAEVEHEILQIDGILNLYMRTANTADGSGFRSRGAPQDQIGTFFLQIHEKQNRSRTGASILEEIRERTVNIAGIRVQVEKQEQGPPTGKAVQLQLSSRAPHLLEPAASVIRQHMEYGMEGLRDIDDTRSLPRIDWELTIDRQSIGRVGASIGAIGYAVQLVTNGVEIGEYHPDDSSEEIEIRARLRESERGIKALDNLWINTVVGRIPLSNLVRLEPAASVTTIQRIDGVPVEYVRADVVPGVLADDKVKEIKAWLAQQNFDPRIEFDFRGASEEQENAAAFLGVAFAIALLLMFIMLVTQFNSFYQSGLIMFSVIMSTAGVLLGLVILDSVFSVILTGVGIVSLAGIVVNNNIVLIDTYNTIRHERPELTIQEIIVRTGAQRLRPVLLTTLTTIFGLLPIATHLSIDFINRDVTYGASVTSSWVPLARAIVSGLSFSTILTLVATPALLALPHYLRGRINKPALIVQPEAMSQEPAPTAPA